MSIFYKPNIVTRGLVLNLDAADIASYPGTGTVWRDLSGNNNHGTLMNGPTFSAANGGVIVLNGVNNYIDIPLNLQTVNHTIIGAARYVTVGGRTFSGKNNNWLMGHWNTSTENYYPENTVAMGQGGLGQGPGDTKWRIYAAIGNYSADSWALYINGKLNAGPSSAGTGGPNGFSVGRYAAGISEYSNSHISFLFCYNRVLSEIEIVQNFNALRGRFGLGPHYIGAVSNKRYAYVPLVNITGDLSKTLAALSASSSGSVTAGNSGSVSSVLAALTASATGFLTAGLNGAVDAALGSLLGSASATVQPGLSGATSVTLASASLAASGVVEGGVFHVRVNGVWKQATPYLRVAGVWKPVKVHNKVNGVWK